MLNQYQQQYSNAVTVEMYSDYIQTVDPKQHILHRVDAQPPYAHPRSIIAYFDVATAHFKHLFRQHSTIWQWATPIVLIQIKEDIAYGLTEIEQRAIVESIYAAGARDVFLFDQYGTLLFPRPTDHNNKQLQHFSTLRTLGTLAMLCLCSLAIFLMFK